MSNTFGHLFRLTTFGESHGPAIGGIVDGMPAGIIVDTDFVQQELDRRRPGQSTLTTQRSETDHVEFLSGIFEGRSTGAPIAFLVRNTDHHSQDYEALRPLFRPSHADYTYYNKYGTRDHRGGGRASARTTISRVVGGALAKLVLRQMGVSIHAYTSQVGTIALDPDYRRYDLILAEQNAMRCPDPVKAAEMEALVKEVKADGDSIGGIITGVISGCPVGLGEPEADKLSAALAHAMLSINAAKGFDYGLGFNGVAMRGSQQNDLWQADGHTATNNSGGIQGGISNGETIYFRVAFKPTPTIMKPQDTIDLEGNPTVMKASGRHDPCVLPRAVPVVEAVAAMVVLDKLLQNTSIKHFFLPINKNS